MAAAIVSLVDGLKVGDQVERDAELRLPSGGDIIDAGIDAERVVPTPEGWQLVMSTRLLSLHVLRRQIVRIGSHKGPLSLDELRKLSAIDLQRLQQRAEELDAALTKAVEAQVARGRSPAPDAGAGGQ